MRVNSTLDDRKKTLRFFLAVVLACGSVELGKTACGPANASFARVARRRFVGLTRDDMIELHDHVGAEIAFDVDDRLGREESAGSVDVTLKLDAVFADFAQRCE